MAILKCKMCGGDLVVSPEMSVATCQYCGSAMTLPKEADERKANLYNRANFFRLNNEFDKASAAYENILNEDNAEAEAHWGLVLCKYGIEYVEDPKSHERIPTCHRTLTGSILRDADYLAALNSSDYFARELYEKEAQCIDVLQKEFLAQSSSEEPYDIFICYKESDDCGNRTEDSVIAQELYYELNKRGFKVFFARKTLEGKLGSAYEPIIFAALSSAKAMVVLGTKSEHFNAVWVRNEWSRYLGMMGSVTGKALIPAYRDISPYELPAEFSSLQAQDMSKLGFMQDLCDGLEKLARKREEAKNIPPTAQSGVGINTVVERGDVFRENSKFAEAIEAYNKALEVDPGCSKAYWGKMLALSGFSQESSVPILSPWYLDLLAGNISESKFTRLGYRLILSMEDYAAYLASEVYIKNLKSGAPTLDLNENYKKAMMFASEEEIAHYHEFNNALVAARLKLVRDGEAARQYRRNVNASLKVIMARPGGFGKLSVALNGKQLGSVKQGETNTFSLVCPPGNHTLTATFHNDYDGIDFEVTEEEAVAQKIFSFTCAYCNGIFELKRTEGDL